MPDEDGMVVEVFSLASRGYLPVENHRYNRPYSSIFVSFASFVVILIGGAASLALVSRLHAHGSFRAP